MDSDPEGDCGVFFRHEHFLVRHNAYRSRLYQLFAEIEKEFESLFAENLARTFIFCAFDYEMRAFMQRSLTVHAKVEALTERLADGGNLPPEATAEILAIAGADVGSKHTSKRGMDFAFTLRERVLEQFLQFE